jgi:hypothetical protein
MSGCGAGSRIDGGVFSFWNLVILRKHLSESGLPTYGTQKFVDIGVVLNLDKGWNMDGKFVCFYMIPY